jgi:hypothetical protein
LLLVILALAPPSLARTKSSNRNHTVSSLDGDYISALSTANRFLQAWQNHDQETGLLLLSDGAKLQTSADNLEAFFSAPQSAYEITRGRKLKGTRYCFSIVLFDSAASGRPRPHYAELVVSRTGREDWTIDNLPAQ